MEKKAAFGLSENVASALAYIFSPLTAFVFLVAERENKTVRFHAMQSFLFFGALVVISLAIGWIPLLGGLVKSVVWLITVVSMFYFAFMAYSGKTIKIPFFGTIAWEQVNK